MSCAAHGRKNCQKAVCRRRRLRCSPIEGREPMTIRQQRAKKRVARMPCSACGKSVKASKGVATRGGIPLCSTCFDANVKIPYENLKSEEAESLVPDHRVFAAGRRKGRRIPDRWNG